MTSAALTAGRRRAESRMVDAGKALRPTGESEYVNGVDSEVNDPLFGTDSEPVPFRLKPPAVRDETAEVGGRTAVTMPAELHLPARPDYADLEIGDLWEVVQVHPQSLVRVGTQYRITNEVDGTVLTACRYTVERVVS